MICPIDYKKRACMCRKSLQSACCLECASPCGAICDKAKPPDSFEPLAMDILDPCGCGGQILVHGVTDAESRLLLVNSAACDGCLKETILPPEEYYPFVLRHCTPYIPQGLEVILVCGDRKWSNPDVMERVIAHYIPEGQEGRFLVIQGCAPGADTMARGLAIKRRIPFKDAPAPWLDVEGRPAGQIRNRTDGTPYWLNAGPYRNGWMLKAKPKLVLAFHNDVANSRGTKDMILQARRAGVPVKLFSERSVG